MDHGMGGNGVQDLQMTYGRASNSVLTVSKLGSKKCSLQPQRRNFVTGAEKPKLPSETTMKKFEQKLLEQEPNREYVVRVNGRLTVKSTVQPPEDEQQHVREMQYNRLMSLRETLVNWSSSEINKEQFRDLFRAEVLQEEFDAEERARLQLQFHEERQ